MTMRILWAALIMSTVMLFGVAVFAARSAHEMRRPEPTLLFAFALLSMFSAAASVLFPRHALHRTLRAHQLKTEAAEPKARMFSDTPRRLRRFSDPERARETLATAATTSMILGMALAESVALFGFALLFMGHPVTVCATFFGACWLLMAVKFPNPKAYERQLEDLYDAELDPLPAQSPVR
jgi:hypothetical protein